MGEVEGAWPDSGKYKGLRGRHLPGRESGGLVVRLQSVQRRGQGRAPRVLRHLAEEWAQLLRDNSGTGSGMT